MFHYSSLNTTRKLIEGSTIEIFRVTSANSLYVILYETSWDDYFVNSLTEPTQYIFRVKSLKNKEVEENGVVSGDYYPPAY